MNKLSFTGNLEMDKDGTWWYVHVPVAIRQKLQNLAKRGMIPVTATIGQTSWDASLMPWADGSAQLGVKKDIRTKEKLKAGQALEIALVPRGQS